MCRTRCRTPRTALALGLGLGAVGILAGLLAAAPAAARAPLRTPAGRAPNVLLVTVDTLRADHLGAYGYPIATSATIDRLAAEGVRVTDCIATAPETAPATASLLTGLYQPRHRVAENRMTMAASVVTLAERLRGAGYATAAFVGNELVGERYGFAQGFEHFAPFGAAGGEAGARADAHGAAAALAWLAAPPRAPWLLWIHFMDPHGPYVPALLWEAQAGYPPGFFGDDPPIPVGAGNVGLGMIPRYQAVPGLDRLSQYVRRYDGEIRFTDAQIGRLVTALGEAAAETLVVVTADHGESLAEHREYLQHGWFVYDTTVRVPLVLRWPGALPAGVVIDAQVSAVDLVPTLLELVAGAGAGPAGDFDGQSFAHRLRAPRAAAPSVPAFAIGARENHPFAVRQDGWKLIVTRAEPPPIPVARLALRHLDVPERHELYDLRADPGETASVVNAHPARLEALLPGVRQLRERFRMSGMSW